MATAKKTTAKKTAAKKPAAKKTAAKKTTAKKTAAKKPAAKKTAAKKTTKKTNNVYVEFAGNKFNVEKIQKAVKADYTKKSGKKTMTSVNIYVKPEDGKAYYVIDRKKGDVAL